MLHNIRVCMRKQRQKEYYIIIKMAQNIRKCLNVSFYRCTVSLKILILKGQSA